MSSIIHINDSWDVFVRNSYWKELTEHEAQLDWEVFETYCYTGWIPMFVVNAQGRYFIERKAVVKGDNIWANKYTQ